MRTSNTMNRRATILAAATSLGFAIPAMAQTWDGGGANANWDTAANWFGDTVPTSGADVTFLSENTSGSTISLNGNRTSGLVTFNNTDSTSAGATTFNGGIASVWTISTGISKVSGQDFTIGSSNLSLQLDADGLYINHNASTGNLNINAPITAPSTAIISINDFTGGTPRAVRVGGNNSEYAGTWVVRRGTLSIDWNRSKALGDDATNTVTFQNTSGDGGNTVTLNNGDGPTATWVNNFVNNNASSSGGEGANINFSGGSHQNASLTLTGSFSSGPSQNATARLYLNAGTSFGTATSEGRLILSGDWSGYNKGGSNNGITLSERGSVIIANASALANSAVGYSIASTTTATVGTSATGAGLPMSAKLILDNAITMANQVNFSGGGGNINSFGTRHSSTTTPAILTGQLSNDDADGANVFAQNPGTTLRLTGQVSSGGTHPLHINRSYTFNDGTGAATATPTGIVEFARATGISYTGPITVHGGTLLVNNTTGSGTGSGTVTVNSGATLGGNGFIGGATTINGGGKVTPGTSAGKLTINNSFTLAATNSVYEAELGGSIANAGTDYDQLVVSGSGTNLALGDAKLVVQLVGVITTGTSGTSGYKIISLEAGATNTGSTTFGSLQYLSTIAASATTFDDGNVKFTVHYDSSGVYVNFSQVPEPASLSLLALGALALRRRRR